MSQIECRNLCIGYDSKELVHNINFSVNAGDYLCVIGENGTGKTTLMKTLLGLQHALSGEVIMGDGLNRNEIGYLPQQTPVQKDFPASVWEIVSSGCHSRGPFYSKADKEEVKRNLKRMEIEDLETKCYRELSGGQQQRVLLARALCSTKKVLVLDEPVTGLDPIASEDLYKCIKSLNDDGITIIMITHDTTAALRYSSHILRILNNKYEYIKKVPGDETEEHLWESLKS